MAKGNERGLASAMRDASGVPQDPAPTGKVEVYVPPSRQGLKSKTFFANPAALRVFKALALELEESEQDLIRRALNRVLAENGKPELF